MPQSAKDCGDGARPVVESSVSTRHTPAQKDTPVRHVVVALMVAAGPFVVGASLAFADGSGDPAAVKNEGEKYYDKEGNPTFKCRATGRGTGSPIQDSAAISRIATSVMVPTPKARVTPRRSAMS